MALAFCLLQVGAPQDLLANCTLVSIGATPLSDSATEFYLGDYPGGLYAEGAIRPEDLTTTAAQLAQQAIVPRNRSGQPDAENGRVVLLSIGMSNTQQEFDPFIDLLEQKAIGHPQLVVVNGAQPGKSAEKWHRSDAGAWDEVGRLLGEAGVHPRQVQVAWIKLAIRKPAEVGAFPVHAEVLQDYLEDIARNLHNKYPNLKLAYVSSRTRAYNSNPAASNPEPYAFESGFTVRWLIDKQRSGDPQLNPDPSRGLVRAPLLLWGPYLWIDGTTPRSDGRRWFCADTRNDDFIHPSPSGQQKVAEQLLAFFATDPTTTPWFLAVSNGEPGSGSDIGTATASPSTGAAPLTVAFTAQGNDLQDIWWHFDDGTTAQGLQPNKTFHAPGTYQVAVTLRDGQGNLTTQQVPVEVDTDSPPPPACTASQTTLCLLEDRFRVEVQWRDFQGQVGTGQAENLTADTGTFWFFNPANRELVVKVLDGQAINGHVWVFFGALSNVEFTLTVTDTQSGAVKIYENPLGTFASRGDTEAFVGGD